MTEIIKDRFFEGERPLFATKDIRLENVKFYSGESALKECTNIEVTYLVWVDCGAWSGTGN